MLSMCYYCVISFPFARSFTQRFFYTQTLLHRDAFDTQWQVHLHANAFTGWCVFHTLVFSHTHALSQIAFNHTCFYIEIFLHRDTFTQRWVYTGMLSHTETLLHTNTFTHSFFLLWATLHTYAKTNRGAFTKDCIDTRSFYLRMFLHRRTFTWFPMADTHLVERVQQTCNFAISPTAFDDRDAFRGRGLTRHKPTLQFDLNAWRSTFREGWVSWTSIHAALTPHEKFRKNVVGAF